MKEELLQYWPLIVAFVSFIVGIARAEVILKDHGNRIKAIEDNDMAKDLILNKIAVDIAEIKTNILWMKTNNSYNK